jgi:hypothetical protein
MQAGSVFFVWLWDLGIWSLVSSLYAVNARSQRALGPASPPHTHPLHLPPPPPPPLSLLGAACALPSSVLLSKRLAFHYACAVVETAGLPLCLCCCFLLCICISPACITWCS